VAEIERRGSYGADGHLSVTSFVESRLGVGFGEAARGVRLARALEGMPVVRAALAQGELSVTVASTLARARDSHPEAFAAAEQTLVEAGKSLPVRGLRAAVEHWRAAVDAGAAEREDQERCSRRGLGLWPTPDGMVRMDGVLDPETGAVVLTAIGAVGDAWARSGVPEDRSPAQIRADALGEVCRGWLDRPDRPEVGTERPHLTVVVDLPTLRGDSGHSGGSGGSGGTGGTGAIDGSPVPDVPAVTGGMAHAVRREASVGTVLSPATIRRVACDAVVSRVLTGGRSQPLEAGRSTRVVPASMRRALVVRDGGCAFPVCDRPPSWCDAHHVRHWADGGPTDLDNLALLCRRHHRMIHAGFSVEMVRRRPVFRRPDGTLIADRAPP
jgi:hypothetical protein